MTQKERDVFSVLSRSLFKGDFVEKANRSLYEAHREELWALTDKQPYLLIGWRLWHSPEVEELEMLFAEKAPDAPIAPADLASPEDEFKRFTLYRCTRDIKFDVEDEIARTAKSNPESSK